MCLQGRLQRLNDNQLFNKYIWKAHYMPGTVLDIGDTHIAKQVQSYHMYSWSFYAIATM